MKRRRRRKRLLDDFKEARRCWQLKEKSVDCTVWRTRFVKRLWNDVKTDYVTMVMMTTLMVVVVMTMMMMMMVISGKACDIVLEWVSCNNFYSNAFLQI
jgi:hypothetical protein